MLNLGYQHPSFPKHKAHWTDQVPTQEDIMHNMALARGGESSTCFPSWFLMNYYNAMSTWTANNQPYKEDSSLSADSNKSSSMLLGAHRWTKQSSMIRCILKEHMKYIPILIWLKFLCICLGYVYSVAHNTNNLPYSYNVALLSMHRAHILH